MHWIDTHQPKELQHSRIAPASTARDHCNKERADGSDQVCSVPSVHFQICNMKLWCETRSPGNPLFHPTISHGKAGRFFVCTSRKLFDESQVFLIYSAYRRTPAQKQRLTSWRSRLREVSFEGLTENFVQDQSHAEHHCLQLPPEDDKRREAAKGDGVGGQGS
jgi:hypothetical protein